MAVKGITGKAQSGKDSVTKHLGLYHGYKRIAFADPVKDAAKAIFNLTDDQAYDEKLKEIVIDYWGLSPRQMFQQVGMICRQTFGSDIWIKRWHMEYDKAKKAGVVNVCVPDVRFDDEASMIKSLGGDIVCVLRNAESPLSEEAQRHESENGLINTTIDYVIVNNGTLKDLGNSVEFLMKARQKK